MHFFVRCERQEVGRRGIVMRTRTGFAFYQNSQHDEPRPTNRKGLSHATSSRDQTEIDPPRNDSMKIRPKTMPLRLLQLIETRFDRCSCRLEGRNCLPYYTLS
jgi:hypothetical protein